MPFKTLALGAWAEDGAARTMEIEDALLGQLTLTVRIAGATESAYTLAADGTDYESTYPLPAEEEGALVYRFQKRRLCPAGAPAEARTLVRYLIAARYYRYALSELEAARGLDDSARKELAEAIRLGRAEFALAQARERLVTHQYEEAGRLLAAALGSLAESGAENDPALAAARRQGLAKDAQDLQVRLSSEGQAHSAWGERVRQIRKALEGARGEETVWIGRLLPDLDGPLSAARRAAILKDLRMGLGPVNYTQALDLLREISFAVRYGEVLKREAVAELADFFAAETAINAYCEAPEERAASLLEPALSFRGLTDFAFQALIRRGARVGPAPKPSADGSPQGPFTLKAPTEELEVAVNYLAYLPPDYHPSRPRPLLLALHGKHAEPLQALQLWGEEAAKRGWLTVALRCPIGQGAKGYLYSLEERRMALHCLAHCAKTFAVDAGRIYVAGHSIGANMAWDLALTYPDRFAAAAAFNGCAGGTSANYLPNLALAPVYCVGAERDLETTRVNRLVFEELQRLKLPCVYREQARRGPEPFHDEIARAMAWFEEHRRPRAVRAVDFVSTDAETSRVHFLAMLEGQFKRLQPDADPAKNLYSALRAAGLARLSGALKPGNAVELTAYNIRGARLFLSAEEFDLTQPVRISVNGKPPQAYSPEPSRRKMLEIARQSEDRDRLYGCSIDVPVPK